MTFDDWCANHGVYLNDSDDAARAARLMARHAWDAAVAESAKLCEQADKGAHPADLADAIRAGLRPLAASVANPLERRVRVLQDKTQESCR